MPFASGGSGGSMPKATYVENIAERNALLLREGLEVVVIDAIADPNVNAHVAARYRYVNSTWKLLAKYSDLTIVQDYLALINKPNSVPANIDDAVSKRHSHTNKDVLDNTTASFTTSEKTKLAGIESEANKYTHPSSHSADMINETTNKQFISFTLKQFLSLLGESDSKLTFRGSIVDSGTGGGGDGSYVHPSSHSADMIDESTTRKWLSTDQQTLLNNLNDVDGKLTYKGLPISSQEIKTDNWTIEINAGGEIQLKCGVPGPYQTLMSDGSQMIYWGDIGSENIHQLDALNSEIGDDGINPISPTNPKTLTINIPYQTEFKVSRVNVLKVNSSASNVLMTLCGFTAGDQSKFDPDDYIEMNGTMKIKTNNTQLLVEQGAMGTENSWYKTIFNNSNEIVLEKIEVI